MQTHTKKSSIMIKVSVLYPYQEGKTFDMSYYCEQHIPMANRLLGPALKGTAVEQGLAGMTPGSPPSFLAMGHLYFETIEDFQTALTEHGPALMGDVPNFTNAEFVVQISEVKI